MSHRVFVIWSGHRKGRRTKRKLAGIRRGEWAYGNGSKMDRELALTIAASLRTQGHKARVVDAKGVEVVIRPKMHPARIAIEKQLERQKTASKRKRRRAHGPPQLRIFGGAA